MKLPTMYAQTNGNKRIDLSLSVNPLGCSPSVVKILRTIKVKDINKYPSISRFQTQLAIRFGVTGENILFGTGSEQLIKLIAQTCIQPGNRVLIERGSFSLFLKESLLAQGNVRLVDLSSITGSNASCIFLANPKTPTGEIIPQAQLQRIATNLRRKLLIIDEANGEFIDESSISWGVKRPNVLVLKTFSKAFGLAGMRIGLVIGSKKLVKRLSQVQQPFPVSSLAIRLAQAAVSDQSFLQKTKLFIQKERIFLQKELNKRGFETSNSLTNNIFVSFPKTELLLGELNTRGVSVIDGTLFPGMRTSGFRLSLRDRKTNSLFLKILDQSMACLEKRKLLR